MNQTFNCFIAEGKIFLFSTNMHRILIYLVYVLVMYMVYKKVKVSYSKYSLN